jgi:hypothetical protein
VGWQAYLLTLTLYYKGDKLMKNKLIPIKGSMDVRKGFNNIQWEIFARKMQKNLFMKEYVLKLSDAP